MLFFRASATREKKARQNLHNEPELEAYEKRLNDIEKKLRIPNKHSLDCDYAINSRDNITSSIEYHH